MAHFDTLIFPLCRTADHAGGPILRTKEFEGASGDIVVNLLWAEELREWDVAPGLRRMEDVEALLSFWRETRNNTHSFLFRDPADYRSCPTFSTPAAADQTIGTGDGVETQFQLIKTYGAVNPYVKTIRKPISGTVLIAVDGVTQTETTHYTVDYSTGVISFVTPPADTLAITAGFEYRLPAKFAFTSDQLRQSLQAWPASAVDGLPMREVRL